MTSVAIPDTPDGPPMLGTIGRDTGLGSGSVLGSSLLGEEWAEFLDADTSGDSLDSGVGSQFSSGMRGRENFQAQGNEEERREKEKVDRLALDVEKRKTLTSKMTLELQELEARLQAADERESSLRARQQAVRPSY
ncbi:hypothetical protein [Phaffia rhodozyma]|uniref:Uncharacterized protein n=1 Tax=Phaffia rhodozyma TaxID=264483 RepID=A0A0F7SJ39_PHARH|nr:hypothetical protein [Phaffia rhodozyma]